MVTGRSRVVVAATVVAMLSGLGLAATTRSATAAPAATSFDGLTFTTSQAMVSTTHKHLRLTGSVSQYPLPSGTSTGGGILVGRVGAPETHDWTFGQLVSTSLSFDPTSGKGKVQLGSQMAPYGELTLTLTASGKKTTTTCGSYVSVVQPVMAKGVFVFDTHSVGKLRWGKVGSTQARTLSGTSTVAYQTGTFQSCSGSSTSIPCIGGVTWSAYQQLGHSNEIAFSGNKSKSTVSALRRVTLTRPTGASRTDQVLVKDKNVKFTLAAKKATVVIGAAGSLTGSATMTNAKPPRSFALPCGPSGHPRTDTTTSWTSTYTNGKTPLTVNEEIEGPYQMSNVALADTAGEASIDEDVIS
jgi:hypothetical protein